MKYLETVRDAGVNLLKSKDLLRAASFFSECLRFADPKYDEIFYEKFLVAKIDAANKLMYCIFELESNKGREYFIEEKDKNKQKVNRYISSENILTQFL